jgi:hypothetical protein
MMETNQLSYYLIDLMKSYINKEELVREKSDELVLQIGTAIDRAKVANQPTTELEYLYETALWLKGEIYK